jgi:hypothetical protein
MDCWNIGHHNVHQEIEPCSQKLTNLDFHLYKLLILSLFSLSPAKKLKKPGIDGDEKH